MESIQDDVGKMGSQLQKWSARLDELLAKAVVAGENAKSEGRERIDALMAKHAAARTKLAELEAAGSEKWDTFKGDIASALDEVETAFEKLTN